MSIFQGFNVFTQLPDSTKKPKKNCNILPGFSYGNTTAYPPAKKVLKEGVDLW